jgi:hypothetical protein
VRTIGYFGKTFAGLENIEVILVENELVVDVAKRMV